MHSKRILSIQRRAKRRLFFMAIVGTAVVGYSALSLFAQDEGAGQNVASKMNATPGVKAVGIRMISGKANPPNALPASTPQATSSSMPTLLLPPSQTTLPQTTLPQTTLPQTTPPQALPPQSPTLQTLPPAFDLPALPKAGTTLPQTTQPPQSPPLQTLPPAFDLPALPKAGAALPIPTVESPTTLPATGFASLPVPPRMSDVQQSKSSGKVVMKLNNGANGIKEPEEAPVAAIATAVLTSPGNNESVEIRVIQPMLLGEPASMPPLVLEKPKNQVQRVDTPKLPAPPAPIRVSVGNSSAKESSSPPLLEPSKMGSDANKAVEPKPRTPKLVKSKPTQISHTVVLAQSAELDGDAPTVPASSEEVGQSAEDEVSVIPHSIARVAVDKEKKGKSSSDIKKNNASQVSLKDTNPEPPFAFDPSASKVVASDLERTTNDARRKFDTRTSKQSVAAVIELESSSATNIDLTGKLLGLAVQDENICKVIQNDRMVSLIGNQVGTTLVQIWSADLGDKPQVIRVNVTQKKGRVQTGRDDVKEIKQVVAQNFPRAEVNIINQNDGSIEVRGTTDSEDSAKRILELIRKVYLVPVKDKLVVSN